MVRFIVWLLGVFMIAACGAPAEELQLGTSGQDVTLLRNYGIKVTPAFDQRPQCNPDEVGATCTLPNNNIVYINTGGLSQEYINSLQFTINEIEGFAPQWDFYLNASLPNLFDNDLVFALQSVALPGSPATAADLLKYDVMRSGCTLYEAAWGPESYAAQFKPCHSALAAFDLTKFEAWLTNIGASTTGKHNYRKQLMCAALSSSALGLGDRTLNAVTCNKGLFKGAAGTGAAQFALDVLDRQKLIWYDPTGAGVTVQ